MRQQPVFAANVKTFDVGLYRFKRQLAGPLCTEDDQKAKNGDVFAILHPLSTVDPSGLYCFGIDQKDKNTKSIVRKNLLFTKVITLKYHREPLMSATAETHEKLNVVVAYLNKQAGEQLSV